MWPREAPKKHRTAKNAPWREGLQVAPSENQVQKSRDSPVIIFSEHRAPTTAPTGAEKAPATEFLAAFGAHDAPTQYSQSAPDPGGRGGPGQKGHSRGPHSLALAETQKTLP